VPRTLKLKVPSSESLVVKLSVRMNIPVEVELNRMLNVADVLPTMEVGKLRFYSNSALEPALRIVKLRAMDEVRAMTKVEE